MSKLIKMEGENETKIQKGIKKFKKILKFL